MDSQHARAGHTYRSEDGIRVRVDTHVCPTRYAAARVAVAVQRRAAPPPRHPPSTCRFAPRARQEVAHQQMHEHGHGSCQQAAAAAASSAVCANEMSEQWCESRGSEPTSIGHNRTQQDTTQERMAERHEQSAQIPTSSAHRARLAADGLGDLFGVPASAPAAEAVTVAHDPLNQHDRELPRREHCHRHCRAAAHEHSPLAVAAFCL